MNLLPSEITSQFLAGLLPDLPRWVEVRSMLLSERGSTLGVNIASAPSFVALEPDGSLAVVVGHPPSDIVRAAASRSRELLAVPENADWVASALPAWRREAATVHGLGSEARLPTVPPGTVRELRREELVAIPDPALRVELLAESEEGTRITAAFAGESPVAFCYAGSVTERWWDISIDTLEPYRRKGHAARCVAFCIGQMARLGKQPVWGAIASNAASRGLAAKLDFRPVDTLFVFSRAILLVLGVMLAGTPLAAQKPLSRTEQRLRQAVVAGLEDQTGYLQRVVDMPSSTLDLDGVRAVGAVFARSLDSLGFETRWAAMPREMRRAGHLIAEHRGKKGKARLLLIGHLDTVVDPDGATFARRDSIATGIGATDMKGGDVVILYALRALAAAGALRDLNLTLVFTGDEEHAGTPLQLSRRDLIDAARRSDLALGFETGHRSDLTVARRGAASWRLTTTGAGAHSAGIFQEGTGYGAIYELARILDEFRRELAGTRYLSFNVATVLGGTDLAYDSVAISGTTASKLNIIPRVAVAHGDLRFISAEQHDSAKKRMAQIVARHLPGTGATIAFDDEYPAMSPTPGNDQVLAVYDTLSQALGYGEVVALDPGRRGAGDISFVAPYLDGVDGLGTLGGSSHTPEEYVELSTLEMQTARAAVFIHRLGTSRATRFARHIP